MSPARARTSRAAIIAAARGLLEDGGLEAVSMVGVAERVGVRAPSLYKHFGDRSGLLAAAATDAALDLGRTLSGAVERSGGDAPERLQALAEAYRSFALAKPRAAALIFAAVAPGATPTPESQIEAARTVMQVAEAIVGPTRALAAARVLTAFAYGFASMESAGAFRFGGEVEEAYRLGISVLAFGLERVAADESRQDTRQASGGVAG
jgi:AcrR family transcriptional regulator